MYSSYLACILDAFCASPLLKRSSLFLPYTALQSDIGILRCEQSYFLCFRASSEIFLTFSEKSRTRLRNVGAATEDCRTSLNKCRKSPEIFTNHCMKLIWKPQREETSSLIEVFIWLGYLPKVSSKKPKVSVLLHVNTDIECQQMFMFNSMSDLC